MTGLPHDRPAALFRNVVIETLRGLHLGNDGTARLGWENIAGIHDHQTVAPQELALLIDGADAITIAVIADADIRLVIFDGFDEIVEILDTVGSG